MRTCFAIAILAMPLAACAPGQGLFGPAGKPGDVEVRSPEEGQARPRVRPSDANTGLRPPAGARTAEEFDTTTQEERVAAVQTAQTGGGAELLGTTIASLGAPSEAGIWMKTPLVSAPAKGRVDDPASGAQVAVDLVPLDAPRGAGSQLSLAAMRLLGVGLTELPEVKVYRLN